MIESEKSVRATDVELKDRLVAINRVTKVTKGGRHFSFSANNDSTIKALKPFISGKLIK